ncbi:hypothetical protein [Kitasatospora sp. NPDC093102]|uniref:hypothetical protein n=1 Tax=Kitasatospora sp. NPDC093102 TaxID=3155069 RepID=UPI00342850C6
MDSAPPTAATDQPADGEDQARLCARPGCSNPLPAARSRPPLYCSRSCRSKVDRAKAKAREAAAAEAAAPAVAAPAATGPAATVPGPAVAPEPAALSAAPAGDDDRWGEDGRHLLGLADALRRKLAWFLEETENGDPVAAFQELALRLPGYSHRVFATAQEIRDKTRWPDLTERERVNRRMRERLDVWGDDSAPADDDRDDSSAPRGESPTPGDDDQEQPVPAAPASAEPELPPAAAPVVLPRQQAGDPPSVPPEPYLRGLGRFDLIQNISSLMQQPGWDLAGWTRARACSTSARPAGRSPGSSTGRAGWTAGSW